MASRLPSSPSYRILQWGSIRWWNACAWYLVGLGEALARRGHVSWIAGAPRDPFIREAADRGLRVADLGDMGASNPLSAATSILRLRRFLRSERIDALIVHTGAGHLASALACRSIGVPLVRVRGDIRPPRQSWINRQLYRRFTDLHVLSAEFLRRRDHARLGVPAERVLVIHGGVDTAMIDAVDRASARREVREALGIPADAPLAGMLARFSPVKGHSVALRAFAHDAVPGGAHLLLAGSDAQLTARDLMRAAETLGIAGRVHVLGRLPDPLRWGAALDVAVIASLGSEAISRSALEYLALGTPVAASRINAVEEVVAGGGGLLFPPGDADALARLLALLLGDPALRQKLGAEGRANVQSRHTLDHFGAAVEGALAKVLWRPA